MGPGVDRYLTALKDWRNEKVQRTGLPPVAVANNTLLKEIARLVPADEASLSEVAGIRKWQIADHGSELIDVVARVREKAPKGSEPKRDRSRRRRTKRTDKTD